jgi:hypothetical protein
MTSTARSTSSAAGSRTDLAVRSICALLGRNRRAALSVASCRRLATSGLWARCGTGAQPSSSWLRSRSWRWSVAFTTWSCRREGRQLMRAVTRALKRELTRCLRTGRVLRRPCRQAAQRKSRVLLDMSTSPSAHPAPTTAPCPASGRATCSSARPTGPRSAPWSSAQAATPCSSFLPDGYKPEHVAPALATKIHTLPESLRRSLTSDQGPEMRDGADEQVTGTVRQVRRLGRSRRRRALRRASGPKREWGLLGGGPRSQARRA